MLQYRDIFYKQYYSSQLGRDATNYKKKFDAESAQLAAEIAPLISAGKEAVICDLGCGTGSLVKVLLNKGYTQSMGVDVSEEMVQVAHTLGVPQVQQADVNTFLAAHKNHFDIITGIDIIEHFTKDELVALLRLIYEALKPGGMVIFRTPNLDAPFATLYANGDFTHENYLNASSARQVMMNCGYNDIAVKASLIRIQNPVKEAVRKIVWQMLLFRLKLQLFATGRSSRGVLFTPNMIIQGFKK